MKNKNKGGKFIIVLHEFLKKCKFIHILLIVLTLLFKVYYSIFFLYLEKILPVNRTFFTILFNNIVLSCLLFLISSQL